MIKSFFFFSLINAICCFSSPFANGQVLNNGNTDFNSKNLLTGIFIENIRVLIPWNIQLDSVKFYGNPKIVKVTRNYTEAQWDSIEIFNGLKLNLVGYFWNPPGKRRLKHFYAYVDFSHIEIIKTHLNSYFGVEAIQRSTFYKWHINKCEIRVGRLKSGRYYFWLMRK